MALICLTCIQIKTCNLPFPYWLFEHYCEGLIQAFSFFSHIFLLVGLFLVLISWNKCKLGFCGVGGEPGIHEHWDLPDGWCDPDSLQIPYRGVWGEMKGLSTGVPRRFSSQESLAFPQPCRIHKIPGDALRLGGVTVTS